MDDFLAEATPEAKLELIRNYQQDGHLVAMTGDGTNDAPARGHGGAIPPHLPPLLSRLGIAEPHWLPLVTGFGRLFHRVAGAPRSLARLNKRRTFRPGQAMLLGQA